MSAASSSEAPIVISMRSTYAGRSGLFQVVGEPARVSALIGAPVMENLDLIVDCTRQRLEPRDPRQIISEIE